MIVTAKRLSLYVDRSSRQWIVVDEEGTHWTVSNLDAHPWEQRQPFIPTSETALEKVPGHYKNMFGLPT